MTVVCLLDHSMRPLGRYHKQLALIGPEQTTRSTGGFDCADAFVLLRLFAGEQAGGGAGEDFCGVWQRVFVEIRMGIVMAGGEIRADHQVGGLSAVGLDAFHEIRAIIAGAEVALFHDF